MQKSQVYLVIDEGNVGRHNRGNWDKSMPLTFILFMCVHRKIPLKISAAKNYHLYILFVNIVSNINKILVFRIVHYFPWNASSFASGTH